MVSGKIEVKKYMMDGMGFAIKDEDERLVTAPVLLPGCKDCDFENGENVLTEKQVQNIAFGYMEHRIVDQNHDYNTTKQSRGYPVESWLLREPTTLHLVSGKTVTYPRGTWMATSKVTDDETWEDVKNGTYKGYSVTAIPKEIADKLKNSSKARVLIKDLDDPVGYTISICKEPCVYDAQFVTVKEDGGAMDEHEKMNELMDELINPSEKAGATFSSENVGVLEKILTYVQGMLDKVKPKEEEKTKQNITGKSKGDQIVLKEVDNLLYQMQYVVDQLTYLPPNVLDVLIARDAEFITNLYTNLLTGIMELVDMMVAEEMAETPEEEATENANGM
jgi:hypothetical protein